MSVVKCCPYSDEKENCKFEIYDGQPRFDKCSTCERMKRCGNCKYAISNFDSYFCNYFSPPRFLNGEVNSMVACKHWELEPFEDERFCAKCKNYVNGHGSCKHSHYPCRSMSMYEEE